MSDVFNRYEKKYKLTKMQYLRVLEELQIMMIDEATMESRQPNHYTVKNIYYDTDDYQLIKHSLSKPYYKEKLRLRGYDAIDSDSLVYLELKKKCGGFVNKRRTSISLSDAQAFIRTGIAPQHQTYHNRQVVKEIEFFLSRYQVKPKALIKYDRIAYESNGLRITFDTNLTGTPNTLRLDTKATDAQPIEESIHLMEVKCSGAMPLWLSRLFSKEKLSPTGFSKYGTYYLQNSSIIRTTKGVA